MINRLAEATYHIGRLALVLIFSWISVGDDDDRNPFRFLHSPQPSHNSKAIPVDGTAVGDIGREVDVKEYEVELLPSDDAQRCRAVHRAEHLIAFRLQQCGYRLHEHKAVINNQDLFLGHHYRLGFRSGPMPGSTLSETRRAPVGPLFTRRSIAPITSDKIAIVRLTSS